MFLFWVFSFLFFFLLLSKVQSSVTKLYRGRCFYKDLSCIISVCLFSLFYFFYIYLIKSAEPIFVKFLELKDIDLDLIGMFIY